MSVNPDNQFPIFGFWQDNLEAQVYSKMNNRCLTPGGENCRYWPFSHNLIFKMASAKMTPVQEQSNEVSGDRRLWLTVTYVWKTDCSTYISV